LEAFRLARGWFPECQLHLFGRGHGPGEEAELWARRRGLCENVHFFGAVGRSTLRERLKRNAQVFVHPSLEESFGMTIAEAMALGIPVIAGKNSGAVANTLDGGRSGVLTDVRSSHALAADMVRVARSPTLRAELARAGADSARKRFRMSKILAAYADVYREAGKA
jgi:glycosyltransferase involved in cell wall biosynthesis